MSPYRTAPHQLAELDRQIREAESCFTSAFWSEVAPVWGVSRGLPAPTRGLAAHELRKARIEELEQARLRAQRGPWSQEVLPDRLIKLTKEMENASDVMADLGRRHKNLPAYRFVQDGMPVALEVHSDLPIRFACTLTTTIVPTTRLALSPEGSFQDLLDATIVFAEVELEDPWFDPVFVVHGDPKSLDALLPPETRENLLRIAIPSTPRIRIADGLASISHQIPKFPAQLEEILRLLRRWHELPSPVPLLQTELVIGRMH